MNVRSYLRETTTADVVPAMVMPVGKLAALKRRRFKRDDDEDDDKPKAESYARALIDTLLEDCPCNIIPDDATPVAGASVKGSTDEQAGEEGPVKEDEAMSTLLGGEEQPEEDEDAVKMANDVKIESKKEEVAESKGSILHQMATLCQKSRFAAPQPPPTLRPMVSESALLSSIGATVPTASVPTGKEDPSQPIVEAVNLSEVAAAAMTAGTPMPEHRQSDGSQIFGAFRRLNKVQCK